MDRFLYDRPGFPFQIKIWMRVMVAVFLFSAVCTLHIFLAGEGASALGITPPEMSEIEATLPLQDDGTDEKADEKEIALKIISVEARIPEDVRKPVGMTLKELQELTDETLIEGEKYLSDFPEGTYRQQVITVLCRLYLMNSNRTFIDSSRLFKERNGRDPSSAWIQTLRSNYFSRILGHLEEAMAIALPEGEVDCKLVRLKGDTYWHSQQYAKAISQYRLVVDRCASIDQIDVVRCALLNSQLRDHDHSGAVATADTFLKHHLDSPLFPHVIHLRGKALLEAGRMRDALTWWKSVEDLIHNAATGEPVLYNGEPVNLSVKTRQDFQRYHEEINFTLGFIEFAMGEYEAAEQSLREEQELLLQRQTDNQITNVGQVYINRTERVYDTLVRLAGKRAPDLDLGDGWIADVSIDPLQEQGNVILLLFAPYENVRYKDTLENLQELYTSHWHEGLRVAWITIPKGRNDLAGQLQKLTKDASSKGLAFPVGMELNENYDSYKAYNCAVGGGTLVAIDRQGNVSWYKMDPTFRDDSIISIVARRLLEQDGVDK